MTLAKHRRGRPFRPERLVGHEEVRRDFYLSTRNLLVIRSLCELYGLPASKVVDRLLSINGGAILRGTWKFFRPGEEMPDAVRALVAPSSPSRGEGEREVLSQ